jgi:TPR repeat protein
MLIGEELMKIKNCVLFPSLMLVLLGFTIGNFANAGQTKSKDDWRVLVQTKLESDWRVLIKQKDYLAAHQLLQAPVDQKKPDALFLLGKMHDKGHGVPKDKKKSFGYFLEAAKKGHPAAMSRIGSAYRTKNSGTDRNVAQSYYWTKKAAETGFPAAWFNLAGNYEGGIGVPRNIENAHMWLNLYYKHEPRPFVKKFLKKFERRMDSEQIWALEKRANNCIQLQYKGC